MSKKNLSRWWVEGLTVSAILFIAALIFTWPLVQHIAEAIPAGSEAPSLASFQLFLVKWTGVAIEQGKSYWNPPFFYPFSGALAWTEPEPFSCLLIWLVAKLVGYILAYNIMLLVYLVGFGLSGYATARLLTEDRISAIWAGIWLTCGAYSLQQMCVINLIAGVFPCSCLFFLFLYAKKVKLSFYWLAVICYFLTWLTSKQSAYFLSLLLAVTLLPFLSRKKLHWSTALQFLLSLVVVAAIVLPYSLKQLSYIQAMGFERKLHHLSAVFNLNHLFMPAFGHWLTTRILGWKMPSWDLGIVPLAVIIISVLFGIFKLQSRDTYRKKIVIGLTAMITVALIFGFGPRLGVLIHGREYSLYTFLFSVIPGFNIMRVPARIGLFAVFGIAVLAAVSLAFLRGKMRDKHVRLLVTVAVFLLLGAEMWTMPVELAFPEREIHQHRGVIDWLSVHANGQAVVELPLSKGGRDRDMEVAAMLRMLEHRSPIVNGYVSFTPVPFEQLRKALQDDSAGRGRRYLGAYGVGYAVLHGHLLSKEEGGNLARALGEDVVWSDSGHTIYLLPGKKQIEKITDILPAEVSFGHKIPKEGKIYGLLLSKTTPEAMLIRPQLNCWIKVNWIDASGTLKAKKIRLRGSVILDSGQERIYLQFLRFPAGRRQGEARLVSLD